MQEIVPSAVVFLCEALFLALTRPAYCAIMTNVKKPLRVYADTSVFGGCFDDEFKTESIRFFEEVRHGQFVLVVSAVTLDELELAPDQVRGPLADLPPQQVEIVSTSPESDRLRKACLEAAIVGPTSSNDAAHVAVAIVSGVDLPEPQDLFAARGCDVMKPGKQFDCVQMKDEIQERLLREVAELGEEEAQRRRAERLASDPILGSFLGTKMSPAEHTPAA